MSSEAKYREDTRKYMVTERGRMPYDSRLVEETRVPDDYVPTKDKIQFVEVYDMPTDNKSLSYDLQRLDYEWQQKWFQSNGDLNIRIKIRKNNGSDDHTILTQIQKYRSDLGDFHRNDETYKLALEEFNRKHAEQNKLFRKREDIRKSLEEKTLHSISHDDANKLGWIVENDPKYKIHTSSKHNTQYVYPNEFREKWTGEKVPLSDKPVWLGKTVIDENSKRGGKQKKNTKMKMKMKMKKTKKTKNMKKSKKTKNSRKMKRTKRTKRTKRNHKNR